jgi:hypothetical protein
MRCSAANNITIDCITTCCNTTGVAVPWCCPFECGSRAPECAPDALAVMTGDDGKTAMWASIASVVGVILAGALVCIIVRCRNRRRKAASSADEESLDINDIKKKNKKKSAIPMTGGGDERQGSMGGLCDFSVGSRWQTRSDELARLVSSMALPKDKTQLPLRSPYNSDHQIYVQRLS